MVKLNYVTTLDNFDSIKKLRSIENKIVNSVNSAVTLIFSNSPPLKIQTERNTIKRILKQIFNSLIRDAHFWKEVRPYGHFPNSLCPPSPSVKRKIWIICVFEICKNACRINHMCVINVWNSNYLSLIFKKTCNDRYFATLVTLVL